MRSYALIVVAMTVLSVHTAAAESGNQLLQYCEAEGDSFKSGLCFGIIEGAVSASVAMESSAPFPICFPEGVTNRQKRSIVVKHLRENPNDLHYNAAILAAVAVHNAFPCG